MSGLVVSSGGGLDGLLMFLGCVGLLSTLAFGRQAIKWLREKWRRFELKMAWNLANCISIWDWGDDDEDVKNH